MHRVAHGDQLVQIVRIGRLEHAQAGADMCAIDHHRLLVGGTARALPAEAHFVDLRVSVDRLAHALEFAHQTVLIPQARDVGLAQFVIALLGLVHDVSQVLEVVRARVALDGVHVAEQFRDGRAVGLGMLADDALVLADEAGRTLDEVMELLLAHGENLADHFQTLLLLVGFGRELAQLGHVAHAQHQAQDRVVFVGNR